MGFTNTAKLYRHAIPRLKCCIHRRARRERREKPYLYYALANFASACSAISSVAGGEIIK